jgi:hypothetical protein
MVGAYNVKIYNKNYLKIFYILYYHRGRDDNVFSFLYFIFLDC